MRSHDVSASISSSGYRPDVDGLRALAVLPVLLFHAGLGCAGGFVGVDVFFVISGYVISLVIFKEIEAGSFSMVSFWERRVRRIMPALSVMVLVVLAAGWLFYLPEDFFRLARSTMAQVLMAANFYFYRNGNYFDREADIKPMLHTWSLAVEEQFYLFFPLVLILLMRFQRRSLVRWMWGLALVSFMFSAVAVHSLRSQPAAFYLLPSRAWELLLGALLATNGGRVWGRRWICEACGWLGLVLVCAPIFFYDADTAFPGPGALPPCIGTALIIASSSARLSSVGRLLAWRPLVIIGLISYPLYLWHWPLLVFARYHYAFELPVLMRMLVLAASFFLAFLSWRFVETPFRARRWFGTRARVFTFTGVTSVLILGIAFIIASLKGVSGRFPSEVLAYAGSRDRHAFREEISPERALAGDFTELGSAPAGSPVSVLLWGDSHAMAVAPAIDSLCREHSQRGVLAAFNLTPPLLNFIEKSPFGLNELSPKVAESVVGFIARNHVRHVVITAFWQVYARSADFEPDLLATVEAVKKAGAKVYVLRDVPFQGFDVPRIAALTALYGGDFEILGIPPEKHRESAAEQDPVYARAAQMGAVILDPAEVFLNDRGVYGAVKNKQALYFDSNHLTLEGAALLPPLFKSLFEQPPE